MGICCIRARTRARFPVVLLFLLGLLSCLVAACGGTQELVDREGLDPRARLLFRWVPYRMPESGRLYFLDRFETRQEDYEAAFPGRRVREKEDAVDLPVCELNLLEGLRLARHYFGRLPTRNEWSFAVGGSEGYRFPWGDRSLRLRANTLELGLWRRTRVGSFESGRNPARRDSCYDLLGNVAEWTITPFTSRPGTVERVGYRSVFDPEIAEEGMAAARAIGLVQLPRVGVPYAANFQLGRYPASQARFGVLGYSYTDGLGSLKDGPYGLEARGPLDRATYIGVRMATDPFTFLAGLWEAEGKPSKEDARILKSFLYGHTDEFRRAALQLLETAAAGIGMPPPKAWFVAAARALGVR